MLRPLLSLSNRPHYASALVPTIHSQSQRLQSTSTSEPTEMQTPSAKIPVSSTQRAAAVGGLALRLAKKYVSFKLSQKGKSIASAVTGAAALDPTGTAKAFSIKAHEDIVNTLCRMRGSVLKLAQMLSIQEEDLIPPHVLQIFAKARDAAVFMDIAQMHDVVNSALGADWQKTLQVNVFREKPFAAASIGQVHFLRLVDGTPCAMKVQFPGVKASIDTDMRNLRRLSSIKLIPPGLFVERIVDTLRAELHVECDYANEAKMLNDFREKVLHIPKSANLPVKLSVPMVIRSLSCGNVLTTTFCPGKPIDAVTESLSQAQRDALGHALLFLTLSELFQWRLMQTDPNFSNYLYDAPSNTLHLIDFGAARFFEKKFVERYHGIVSAGIANDRAGVLAKSKEIGLLTGLENEAMREAHYQSVRILAQPFQSAGKFDFAAARFSKTLLPHMKTMVKNRICPPPLEVYSLHRRLSGVFLLCGRMNARVDVKEMWDTFFAKMG